MLSYLILACAAISRALFEIFFNSISNYFSGLIIFFIIIKFMTKFWIADIYSPTEFTQRVNFENCFLGIYPEFFLIIILSILIGFLVIIDYKFKYKVVLTSVAGKILLVVYLLLLLLINNNVSGFLVFNDLLIVDNFTTLIKNILVVSLICIIIVSLNYIKAEKIDKYEYFLLVGLSSLGMFTIVSSNDLITMYLGIEIQSLCFYILATIKIYNNFSTEAGLKYFILGAFSSGLLLFGCSFIYGALGTTNFTDMRLLSSNFSNLSDNPISLILGIIFVIVAIMFKIGAAPFHMWVPDVYEGIPTIVTAFFAIVPKIAIFSLLVRLQLSLFYENLVFTQEIFIYAAILSITIGTLGALYQTKLKRLLAYSAISHVGFLLLGFVSFNNWSIFSLFFYLIIYIIISINIFTVLLVLRKIDNNLKFKKINELVILFKSNPLLAINFCLILFSIAGIPPLVGFYSKLYIFISALKSEIYITAILAAILSVIASMYYIRLIKLMFFKNFEYWALCTELTKKESLLISITFFFNLFFFCYPELFVISIYNIILNLFY